MNFLRCIRFGAILLLVPWLSACNSGASSSQAQPEAAPKAYQTEQEWIVASVCRDIYELLSYAKDKKGDPVPLSQVLLAQVPGDPLGYEVTVQGARATVKATLQWPDSIWSASAYLPFCRAAVQALQVGPSAGAQAEGNPLHTLLDFSETAIEAENHRVSEWLTRQPGNPAAHEQAALVLGAFAMKDNAGYFWDPRDACSQACAHLAVAQTLRAGDASSVEGRLGAILVGLIADTKTQTGHDLDQLAAEPNAPADLGAWINAGRMRNSRDWRIEAHPETASPLEQVEYFRALGEATDTDQAIGWLQAHSIPDRPDWGRIVLEEGFSVQAGHVFAQPSITQELHAMQTTFPGSFEGSGLVGDLNQPPGDVLGSGGAEAGTLTVISRGLWARFFQRQLCQAIAQTGAFFANAWGVPENTQALDQAVSRTFPTLTLYPYLQLENQEIRNAPVDTKAALALFQAHPEWAPFWAATIKAPTDEEETNLRRAALAWFKPRMLNGTAYDAFSRLGGLFVETAQIQHLYAIAPLQFLVADLELKDRFHGHYTLAQARDVLGAMIDYYGAALNDARQAYDLTFDQKVQLAGKAAALNPDGYHDLAELYLENHQDDEAAVAYQQWFDKALDRVEVSNDVEWLVNYYFSHGQTDKAMAVARDAAEVYSERGLQTMLNLQEKMGQLDQAEDYGRKIQERYNDSGPLAGFYARQAGNAAYAGKLNQVTASIFPDGFKKVTLASFSGPPDSGMKFAETTDAMHRAGLSAEQVVVALDGYDVQNQQQYTFVRTLSDSPTMKFIVWDGQAYREITARQAGRRFNVGMQDYRP